MQALSGQGSYERRGPGKAFEEQGMRFAILFLRSNSCLTVQSHNKRVASYTRAEKDKLLTSEQLKKIKAKQEVKKVGLIFQV